MHLTTPVNQKVQQLKEGKDVPGAEIDKGTHLFDQDQCLPLFYSGNGFEFLVEDGSDEHTVFFELAGNDLIPAVDNKEQSWDRYSIAALLRLQEDLQGFEDDATLSHKWYTREGMIRRVLKERRDRAEKAWRRGDYHIEWADNIYGDHILTNEKGKKYTIFLRDFENETGYSDSDDARNNKLGTTKHIMFAFKALKEDKALYKKLDKTFPFVEVYLDPLQDYQITWFYPNKLSDDITNLLEKYFGEATHLPDEQVIPFLGFIQEARNHEQIVVRPEVHHKVEKACDDKLIHSLAASAQPDLSFLNITPFPYQEEGIRFSAFRRYSILADEMGLGKTLQAIAAAVVKKQVFQLEKTIVVCPASLKEQWKDEIEKYTGEKAFIVEGTPAVRKKQWKRQDHLFFITNYEMVMRDYRAIQSGDFDFMILDEAQRVKNYETKTFYTIKEIAPRHVMAITGTPIENRLIDIYSIMQIMDQQFFGPLWEFSYKHCLFDPDKPNKINGYYNLNALKQKLDQVVLRREKRKLLDQLPGISQIDVPVEMSEDQAVYHASYAQAVNKLLRKKYLTPADLERIMMNLLMMRMVCNSTYLVDKETHVSPKMEELERILLDKLDLKGSGKKVIIFSEWVKCHKLIAQKLRELGIGYTEFNGSVPSKQRGKLIRKFEEEPDCQVFLSTESGGAGLNLQVADTLINFELPWNPAKKNQRIGRIDRLGQENNHLTVINLITKDSIETRIAAGLVLKQNLFDGVLDEFANIDMVDFSEKGKSQFLKEIEKVAEDFSGESDEKEPEESTEAETEEDMAVFAGGNEGDTAVSGNGKEGDSGLGVAGNEGYDSDTSSGNKETSRESPELEEVLNQGMNFFSGLYKMATGEDMAPEDQKVEVDKETGEVTMKFKLPGYK